MASSQDNGISRRESDSQASQDSQTAAEFISSQLQLEEEAREALPYKFDSCTRELGPLRQLLFACITCNPPPKNPSDSYNPAGVCYSCSIQCHGEHELVELFNKRNFVCDCGTTRLPKTSPCTLRFHPETKTKGDVHSESPTETNKYNQNFANRFCGCSRDYDPHQQKGTMFQCLGLGSAAEGGCGEDWWHPGCIVGLGPDWNEDKKYSDEKNEPSEGLIQSITKGADSVVDKKIAENGNGEHETSNGASIPEAPEDEEDEDDEIMPPGFPNPEDFDGFICYKCVEAHPWIKRYAGTEGFLGPVFRRSAAPSPEPTTSTSATTSTSNISSLKRKVEDDTVDDENSSKRLKEEIEEPSAKKTDLDTKITETSATKTPSTCKYVALPPRPTGAISLFLKPTFREHLCRCSECFPLISKHSQLLEEEDSYEHPLSEFDDVSDAGGGTTNSGGSLYDRGESALKNIDRVKAIEGVMAYNHLKEKLRPFFKEFAESGKAIGAEDITAYFAKLRGDEEAIKEAGQAAGGSDGGDNRKEEKGC